jgi:hypothetical protein
MDLAARHITFAGQATTQLAQLWAPAHCPVIGAAAAAR